MFQNIQLTLQNKILILAFVAFIILSFILSKKNEAVPETPENKTVYADTLIPKGYVLVPVELANIEAVASLIDHYGIIDLYAGPDNRSQLIAGRVKVMRAPLNPSHYAVMVAETLSQEIMKFRQPFWAVVQNRYALPEKTEVAKPTASPPPPLPSSTSRSAAKIEIEYYQGDSQ